MSNFSSSSELQPSQAAIELLSRRRTRQSLTEWARHCGYEPAAHHRLLIEQLTRVSRGEIDRLLICMPPGAAKSTYASVLFPAWFLANHPAAAIIAASHTTELSERWGRRVRNLVIENAPTLDIALVSDSQAAGRWELTSGGSYLAAGVGQAILGYRADLVVIDDPIRSREDAASETIRRSTWEWFSADLKTRLKPGGRVILIQTRWHEDDLAGRVLAEMEKGGDHWHSLVLPAVAEEGDPLGRAAGTFLWDDDPNYEFGKFLRREQQTQPAWNWAALYQQRPAPESGDYFRSEWLKPYEKIPPLDTLRVFAASDYAVTSKGGDYTVHLIVGVDPADKLYLLDLWRGQTTPDLWVDRMLDMAKLWKPISWAEETGQIKASVGPFLDRRMAERKIPIFRKQFPTKGDKSVRAQSIRGKLAMDGLYVPTKASWYAAFQQELLTFPSSKHDDMVDALGLIGQLLTMMQPQPKAVPEKKADGPYGHPDASYALFRDSAQLDRWLSGDDMVDHGDGYTSIATL
jgi:predicted phage terminase large subunit-like protein